MSSRLRRAGAAASGFDTLLDPCFDLTDRPVVRLLGGWISSGVVAGLHLGTPCASWSRARRGRPPPLRNDGPFIMGFTSGLSEADFERIRIGNLTMRSTARLIQQCIKMQTPTSLENPATSRLWLAPPLQRLQRSIYFKKNICDFCQHKMPWRKRTRVDTWHCMTEPAINKMCVGKGRLCSRTGREHIQLTGVDPHSKLLWTRVAEPYPPGFASGLARMLLQSADRLGLHRLAAGVLLHEPRPVEWTG